MRTMRNSKELLLNDLVQQGRVEQVGDEYRLAGSSEMPLLDDPNLEVVVQDIQSTQPSENLGRGVETAKRLAQSATTKRSHDFAASAHDFIMACRI